MTCTVRIVPESIYCAKNEWHRNRVQVVIASADTLCVFDVRYVDMSLADGPVVPAEQYAWSQ